MIQKQYSIQTLYALALVVFTGCSVFNSAAQEEEKPAAPVKTESQDDFKPFDEVVTEEAETDSGFFDVHTMKDQVYFEVPDSLLNKDMLIVSRRAAMSSSELDDMVAGERATDPLMVRWEKAPDEQHVLLKKVTTRNHFRFTGMDESFENSVNLQTLDPILLSFPIEALGEDSTSSVIDANKLFVQDIEELTPFRSGGLLEALGVVPPKNYVFQEERSHVEKAQSFDNNIEVRSMLTYTEGDNTDTYSILMHRSMVLLPDNPMMPRIADERVGNFSVDFMEFDEASPVDRNHYVKRWRMEVPEDKLDEFEQGELVEPEEKIIFYLDEATPQQWREYIKKGVEDWKPAFEEAGFKNAIEAKEIPEDDPDFHPEDVRHSVIRYAASDIPNAKGPSVVDPRTGEILESDVIMYHNVIQLIRDWRFSQTAANDPEVRTSDIPDDVVGEGLRFVVAHEVGHALGLRHNMGASDAFPVDSLRSASFTQEYGNTPSIMDYARFNYVAQPEDEGVKVTPPKLGAYDEYAISWAYKPIPDADNAMEETSTLDSWIEEHAGDPIYHFGEGDLGNDPTSLRENLGDDVVKASEYGVENARYIIEHIDEWLSREGERYDDMENFYSATLKQYNRYLGHVGSLVGGIYQRQPRQGQNEKVYSYVSAEEQKEAVQFLLRQYKELPQWLENEDLKAKLNIVDENNMVRRIVTPANYIERLYYSSFRADLVNDGKLMFMLDQQVTTPEAAYSPEELFSDIRNGVFEETVNGGKPDYYGKLLQNVYVDWLMDQSHLDNTVAPKNAMSENTQQKALLSDNASFCGMDFPSELLELRGTPGFQEVAQAYAEHHDLYFQIMDLDRYDKKAAIESLVYSEVRKVEQLLEGAVQNTQDEELTDHYSFLLRRLNVFLNAGS